MKKRTLKRILKRVRIDYAELMDELIATKMTLQRCEDDRVSVDMIMTAAPILEPHLEEPKDEKAST